MAKFNAPKDTVREVKLSGEKRDELREYLKDQIECCITDRTRLMEKCKVWVEQANSRRKRKDATARDANIDMPLTRQRMMQNSARLCNPIFQQDPLFVTKPRNPAAVDLAREIERTLDYISDQIDYRTMCDEWIEQFQMFPFGVVKTPFVYEEERIIRWKELVDEQGMPDYEDYNTRKLSGQKVVARKMSDGSEKLFLEVDERVPVRSGVCPEVVPFEDFFVPMCAKDVRSADWVMHRIWMTKAQIEEQINRGVYNKKDGDVDILEALGEPTSERERLIKFEPDDKGGEDQETSKQFEVMEAYLKWDIGGDGPVEIVVSFDRESGTILRCVHNFYHAYRRPFVTHCYKRNQGSIFGTPLTYILEPLHVAYSAAFCQRLDAASKANESLWCFPPNSSLEPILDNDSLRTSIVETTASKDEVFELKLSQPFTQLPELENKLVQEADMLAGLSQYSWGNEQIDRPTASGQIQLIEESKQPQYMQLERFRASLAEVCKHALARYKQFYPEGLQLFFAQEDPQGKMMTEQFFVQWPDEVIEKSVIIETKVSSASMSKNLRKQELVALIDKLGQIYQQMMQYAQAASDPMNPVALPSVKILNGLWTVVNEMLTEFEVGKKDALNPRLVEDMQVVQQIQQQMQQMGQQINQLSQQNSQLQQQNAALQQGVPPQPGVPGQPQQPPGVQGPGPMGPPAPGPGNPQMAQG